MKGTQFFHVFIALALIYIQIVASGKSCKDKSLAGCHCKPICGRDNFTYTDECFLKAYNENCGKDVKVMHPGPCKGKVKLPPVTECYPGNGICAKNTNKPRIYDPVCSTSGQEFGNSCEFHYQRKMNKTIEFGKCGEC